MAHLIFGLVNVRIDTLPTSIRSVKDICYHWIFTDNASLVISYKNQNGIGHLPVTRIIIVNMFRTMTSQS
jgi:hypothetical protein